MHIEESPLDSAVVDTIRELQADGSPDLFSILALAFIDDAQGHLAHLRAAVAAGDVAGVKRAAHSLKGISGAIGAQPMAALSIALEQQALGSTVDRDIAAGIYDEFGRVETALRGMLQ